MRQMREISWTHRAKKEEVFPRVKGERNILRATKRRKAEQISDIQRRKHPLNYVIERKIEGKGRRGRIRKQLLDQLKKRRKYWNLKQETLNRMLRRPCGDLWKRLWTCCKTE